MEIAMLSCYRHRNVVSLVGFCDECGEKIVVYEHEKHGSLDQYLSGKDLTWKQRLQISIDAARGFNYLHNDVGPHHRVLHRDIKSSNILLNDNWEAKISDFGLSKIGPSNLQFTFLVTNACGTYGYVDPLYVRTGILTKESDVYSFGVVLFEILCGRLACIESHQDERRFLAPLAQHHYENDKLDEIIDPQLRKQMKLSSLKIFSNVAYDCLKENRSERPTMGRIVERLEAALELQLRMVSEDSCVSPYDFGNGTSVPIYWEQWDIISRDGCMKLQTEVLLASIDQQSELAEGDSACTSMVVVMADWFQNNQDRMPTKSELDSLIRAGFLEWGNLCDDETYNLLFPDKNFDLETVLQANARSLCIRPEKSFIGFFHLDELNEVEPEFMTDGTMPFDSMWDEVSYESEILTNGEPRVYIVSLNDHLFVLKIDSEACYMIDSLGERLFKGCNQAYILKFDQKSVIHKLPAFSSLTQKPTKKSTVETKETTEIKVDEVICHGKECCKEYIKSFWAAIFLKELKAEIRSILAVTPLREVQATIKHLLSDEMPLRQRLQIEFYYTEKVFDKTE